MKRILGAIICIIAFQTVDAQTDSLPIYRRFPTIPPFSILKVPDSSRLTKEDLEKKKTLLIMLFNPDCDHCRETTKDLLEHIDLFEKTQIIMVSSMDFSYIKKFYNEQHIAAYPLITMARDPAYFLGTFYNVQAVPAVFIYSKKGKFLRSFEGIFKMEEAASFF